MVRIPQLPQGDSVSGVRVPVLPLQPGPYPRTLMLRRGHPSPSSQGSPPVVGRPVEGGRGRRVPEEGLVRYQKLRWADTRSFRVPEAEGGSGT